jgi:hypothetical protein
MTVVSIGQRTKIKLKHALDSTDVQSGRQLAAVCQLPKPMLGMTCRPTNLGFRIRLGRPYQWLCPA